MFENQTVTIIGGTGTLGHELCSRLLTFINVKEIRVVSRDEFKQYHMKQLFNNPKLKFIIGDCRDFDSIVSAIKGSDIVIHAAALKHVPVVEDNPLEAIKTNIFGTENVARASVICGVKKLIGVSTDKCVAPANLYGATKLCLEKIILYANVLSNFQTKASVVRYGNVFCSRGSVVPLFLKQKASGELTVTDSRMTRFTLTIADAVELIFKAIDKTIGGEIYVPIISSYKIMDLAKLIGGDTNIKIVGIRPGEKLHECMIAEFESTRAIRCDKFYVIYPDMSQYNPENFINAYKDGILSVKEFEYNSLENEYIDSEELKCLIGNYTHCL